MIVGLEPRPASSGRRKGAAVRRFAGDDSIFLVCYPSRPHRKHLLFWKVKLFSSLPPVSRCFFLARLFSVAGLHEPPLPLFKRHDGIRVFEVFIMVFTAASRAAIAANDPAYLPKLRFRAAASLVLLVSLGALTFVITYSSNFKSAAFTADSDTWICLPLVRASEFKQLVPGLTETHQIVISLIWNLINIAVLAKFKRPLNPFFNLFSHGLLALLFIVVGAIAARAAARANSVINANPYAPPPWAKETGPAFARPITANDGSTVTVTPETVDECPAFASCAEQETWMLETQHRSTIASAGVALFFLCM